ncbi:hypothetical protein E2562_008304 [Oryza meyeriana var. granulata]|uniref:Uncharacterized protein n=1 Tax=Oryza meyeriana var. granulata TaxID=110450 RepID=A0A6G1DG98_9ORYZ|nr:hypothetical protein E2562_008304 [Oryza meyeriana var. granulata]
MQQSTWGSSHVLSSRCQAAASRNVIIADPISRPSAISTHLRVPLEGSAFVSASRAALVHAWRIAQAVRQPGGVAASRRPPVRT